MVAFGIAGYASCFRAESFTYFLSLNISYTRIHVSFFLSQVDTTEEARLLLDASDPTQCQTDSDDDLLHA